MSRYSYPIALIAVLAVICSTALAASPLDLPNTKSLSDTQAQTIFVSFLKEFKKVYEMEEIFNRLNTFRENVNWMLNWNANKDNTHQVGINFFADLKPEEWAQYRGLNPPKDWKEPDYDKLSKVKDEDDVELQAIRREHNTFPNSKLADKVNWNEKGVMLPVRDQSSCGSCYVFSALATVEALFRQTYPDEDYKYFSIQQSLDCTGPRYGCNYCSGGWMANVFEYLIDNKGVCLDEDYPYQNRRTLCKDSQCDRAFAFQKYRVISGAKESTIMEHLNVNPHAIAVTSATRQFMYYKSGVITYCGSPSAQIDHAVTTVGYDLTGQIPYVLIRNSWSPRWGENGHVRVGIGNNSNVCKYRANVSYPVLVNPQKEDKKDKGKEKDKKKEKKTE